METYQVVTHHTSRPRTEPRNITGVFLSTKGASRDSAAALKPRYKVPPLARSRASPSQSKTPTEHKRYAKIETLRSHDGPRGFNPPKVLKHKKTLSREVDRDHSKSLSPNQELFRQTPRKFTPTTNDGMLHLEYLNVNHKNGQNNLPSNSYGLPQSETVIGEEVQRLALSEFLGVEDCYKRICASNPSTLQTLLPSRKGKSSTPMTVKSFTTQATPHTLIHYTELDQTLTSSTRDRRPVTRATVPAPFFFDSNRLPRAKTDLTGSKKKIIKLSGTTQPEQNKILAAPGVGVLSRSNTQGLLKHQMRKITGLEGLPPPTKSSANNSDPPSNSKKEDPRAPTASPISEFDRLEVNGHALAQPNLGSSSLLFIPVGSKNTESDKEIRQSPRYQNEEVKKPIAQKGSSFEVNDSSGAQRNGDDDGDKSVRETAKTEEEETGHQEVEPVVDLSEMDNEKTADHESSDQEMIEGEILGNQSEDVVTADNDQVVDPTARIFTEHTSEEVDVSDQADALLAGETAEVDQPIENNSNGDEQSSLSIVISCEDENGQRKTPVMGEETEFDGNKSESVSIQSIEKVQEKRKKFDTLLDEHSTIVNKINELEKHKAEETIATKSGAFKSISPAF